jgi:hypothetical protein
MGLLTSIHQFESFIRKQEPVGYSRPFLEPPGQPKMQLGIYPIFDYSIRGEDGSNYFVTCVSPQYINVGLSGFAFKPSMERSSGRTIGRTFRHLWGDWYTFEETENF